MPEILAPIVRWQPGQLAPDAQQISYRLQKRWKYKSSLPTIVYLATERTVQQFGGNFRSQTKVAQVTHDLGLTATWIRYHQSDRQQAKFWVGEDVFAPSRHKQKLPDAVMLDRNGDPALLVEFGGRYSPERVAAFHSDAERRNIPYHLW